MEPSVSQAPSTLSAESQRHLPPFTSKALTQVALAQQLRDALLPAHTASRKVQDMCSAMHVKVVVGETGCGESTQIPQMIAEDESFQSVIWISTSRVKACMDLQERLTRVTQDVERIRSVSAYHGIYSNDQCTRGQEVVAVHTTETALLRFKCLYDACQKRKDTNHPAPHLIIDEAGDRTQELIITAGLTLQRLGLLHVWVMSATMPQRVLQHLQKEPHELVNLGGLPYGLRIVTVTCNRDEWLDL